MRRACSIWPRRKVTGPARSLQARSRTAASIRKKEIWDNYEDFIKQIAPLAEQLGIFIGIHPDDPPVPMLGGVPRCIFGNIEGYKRALEIANSPSVGVSLCCGTWLEGGE